MITLATPWQQARALGANRERAGLFLCLAHTVRVMTQCAAMPTNVTITEAARILGVSRRTVYRQIETGELHSIQVGNARRVVLDTASITPAATSDSDTENAQLRAQVAALTAELEVTRQDRDRWHEHAQRLGTTIDRMTVTTAQLSGTIVEQQALDTGQDTADAPRPVQRPWWRFWVR